LFLDQLKKGSWAVIEETTDDESSIKLIEMGCLPGERVRVLITAPFRDPIAIEVSGNLISLRKSQAKNIKIRPEEMGKEVIELEQ
jgi:ferrous iron transport protein A